MITSTEKKEITRAAKHSIEECTKAAKVMTAVYTATGVAVATGMAVVLAGAIKSLRKKG